MDLTAGYPYWPVRNGLIRTYPSLDGNLSCDVVVIGGGITGSLVAHHLVEAGVDTVVIDRREIGWGSTAALTAVLQYEIDVTLADLSEKLGPRDAERAYLACRDAVLELGRLAERLPDACGFSRRASLYLASRQRDVSVLERELELRRAIGLDVDWLDERSIARRFSFRRPAALLTPEAAQVDPHAMTHALLHDASTRGLRVFDRTTVKTVTVTRNGVTLDIEGDHELRAQRVVYATGYETQELLGPRFAKLTSTFAMITEPVASFEGWGENRCVIWEHRRPYLYLRTTDDGRIIVGGEDEPYRDHGHRDRVLPKKTKRLIERCREMFPNIDARVAFSWAGTFGETEDGLAFIGEHRDWKHAYFALGYGGNGITFGLIAAEVIREAIQGRVHPSADLFRFGR